MDYRHACFWQVHDKKCPCKRLEEAGIHAQVLESDEIRKIITPKPSYSLEERDNFYRTMVYIGELLVRNGVNVIFDATANKRLYRDNARGQSQVLLRYL